jgi:hypothetical protein
LDQLHPGNKFSTVEVKVVDERGLRLIVVVKLVLIVLAIVTTQKGSRRIRV